MNITVKARDWDEVRRRILAFPDAMVTEIVGSGAIAAAKGVIKRAKGYATFNDKTGYLRRSMISRRVGWRYDGVYVKRSAALALATPPKHTCLLYTSPSPRD